MKYFTTAVVISCLFVFSHGLKCPIYKSGDIINPVGSVDRGVTRVKGTEGEPDYFKVARGQKPGTYGSTPYPFWDKPSDDQENAYCMYGTDPSWPPVPDLKEGESLDGDYCTKDSHCYQGASFPMFCINNECVTKATTGDRGLSYRDCPRNHNCILNKGKIAPAEGEEGGYPNGFCQYGLSCISTNDPDFNDYRCFGPNSLKEGDKYAVEYVYGPQIVDVSDVFYYQYASHGQTLFGAGVTSVVKVFQCRKIMRSKTQKIEDYKGAYDTDIGYLLMYDSPDYSKYDKPKEGPWGCYCGFNQDDHAYCRLAVGDDIVIDALKRANEKITVPNTNCHPQSKKNNQWLPYCVSAIKEMDDEDVKNGTIWYMRAMSPYSAYSGYSRTANNDECVANTITKDFWRGLYGKFS